MGVGQKIPVILIDQLPLVVQQQLLSAFPEANCVRVEKTDERGTKPVGKPVVIQGFEVTSYWSNDDWLLLRIVNRNDNWKLTWYKVLGAVKITET